MTSLVTEENQNQEKLLGITDILIGVLIRDFIT
jgi:hypothetical protein